MLRKSTCPATSFGSYRTPAFKAPSRASMMPQTFSVAPRMDLLKVNPLLASAFHSSPKLLEDSNWTEKTPNLTKKYEPLDKLFVHRVPTKLSDKVARIVVSALRVPMDAFFAKRYGSRAVVLETIAAVPGMVGGMWLHLNSLRRFEVDKDHWIHELLDEAENERMHLVTFMEIAKPSYLERMFVLVAQGIFWNAYFLLFLLSQRTAHRLVGYLEEEAVISYTRYLKEIDEGRIENIPAPKVALEYWDLPEGSTLRDVVLTVRADECGHRDRNHFFCDEVTKKKGVSDKLEYTHGEARSY